MSIDRQLREVDEQWIESAREMLAWGWDVREQADHHGLLLAQGVLSAGDFAQQKTAAADLRTDTQHANRLDREVVAMTGGDLDSFARLAQRETAYAVRIWHHSGLMALRLVGTEGLRMRTRIALDSIAGYMRNQTGQGLGAMEAHDVSASLVLARVKRR